MEIFTHSPGKDVAVHDADPDDTVGELRGRIDATADIVLLEGEETPLTDGQSLTEAGIANLSNLYVGSCRRVGVSIRYQQETKEYEVPPSATLESLYARAVSAGQGFGLSESDQAQYTLQVRGGTLQPDLARHVGSFAGEDCTAAFDLVIQDRFQG
jgi:hypothetical protein